MYVRFYICDVATPILGVNDLVGNNVELNLRNFNDSYLQQHDQQASLQYVGRHFYIPAIVTEANKINVVWQTIVQQEFFDDNTHYSQLSGILASDIELEDSNMEARPATTLRTPTTPSPQEVAQHNLTHMPYRSWCPICVQSKGRSGQHRRHQHQHSVIQLDYCFMHNPHPTTTVLTDKPKNIVILTMVENITGLCSAVITPRKGPTRHQLQHLKRFVMEHGFANSIIQTDGENAITELAQQAAHQLGLPTRQSPTYDHRSQGSVERFHQTLFAQLRATRFQWASHLGLEHHNLPPLSLPWLLQHSVFLINRFLVRNNGQTSFAANYGYNYTAALLNFGEIVYADIKRIDNRKLAIRNEHQKVTGIWLGRDHTTGQHLIALPDQYRDHPGVSGNNVYKTRHVTRLPAEQQFNQTFLWTIEWPLFDISHLPSVTDNEVIGESNVQVYQQLLQQNTSLREQRSHQPPQPTNDIAQPAAASSSTSPAAPTTNRSTSPAAPTTNRSTTSPAAPTTIRPTSPAAPSTIPHPPGLPLPKQLPGAHLRPPSLTSTPASASTSTTARPVAPPPAPPQTHRPAGRHRNPSRPVNVLDDSISSGVFHLAVNEHQEEAQQSASALLDNIILQPWYQDDLSSYDDKAIKQAMLNEFQQLQQQNVGTPVNKNTLSEQQRRSIIDTRWAISERPSSSASASSTLKARFCGKGYTQEIANANVETYAATPSSQSLRLLLQYSIIRNWAVTSLDVSSAFLNTPITTELYVVPPREFIQDSNIVWRLNKALYGLRTAPKLWQRHLGATLASLHLEQLKSDRCVWVGNNFAVLCYVDDLIVIGEQTASSTFIKQLSNIFDLKHVSVLSPTQPLIFLGKKLVKNNDNSISISLSKDYYQKLLQPFGLHNDSSNSLSTPMVKRPPLDSTSPLTKEQHHQYRQSVGQLLWLSLVRPDLQHAARDLSKHLVAPTQLDLQQLKHCLRYVKGTQHYQLLLRPQLPAGFHLPLRQGQRIPLLIECFSDSDWAGDVDTRQSTSGSLVTILKNNMHSSSKTQQVIATSSAEAELYALSSTVADAIHLKQLVTEIENNIGVATFDLDKHQPNIVLSCDSSSATSLVQKMGINKRTKHIQLRFLWIQDLHQSGHLLLRRVSTENNPADAFTKPLAAAPLQRHLSAVGIQTDVANEAGEYNNIFFVVDNIKKKKNNKQRQAALCQQLRPQQALQVVQLTSAATTDLQQQLSGQQLSILQLSGGTADNKQQVDQQQAADNRVQLQQEQLTTSEGQLIFHNELFMIQHQADSLEAHQDPPTSATTTRRESQRSSLEIIAEALNRQQQQRRGRRHLSPQPILTPLSTSSVGEMHQSQRSNNDNNDRGEETTKEEEERQLPRQRRQHNDIKKEEGSKDNKTETTTTKKEEGRKKEEKTKKEERKVKEEEGKGEEDRRRRRRPSSQPRRWTTTTIMTTTFFLFLFIFCLVFICHLPRPLSESTGSTSERVGATSSSTNNLSDIKQRLVNSIEILLDNNNKVDIGIDNKERQQQDSNNMASADQPSTSAQTAAQASVEPTMVPSSAGTSTADLPRINPININESNILRQLNAITINMKLRDNMLYQTSSPTLLNFYDQFSSVVFLGNSTPINRDDVPISKHISDFINNMKPAQRSPTTTPSSEWFIVLTEEEHLYYQQHQHLQTRPFTHHQQQRPRLHSDSVSAINYIIYVASTAATTSSSYLPNVPNDATLYLYSFILNPASATTWQRYNRRAGYQELEPSTGTTVSPTTNWGFLNMVVEGATAATLSFIRDSNFQQQHLIDYNLISSPTYCHIASIIAMIQHPAIRNRIRGWLNQHHHGVYSEFFNSNGDIRSKWLQQDPTTGGNVWSQPGATMAAATFGQQDTTSASASAQQATSAPAASASANQPASSTTTLASGTSITINNVHPGTSFVIKYKRYNDDNDDVQMDNING